MALDRTSYLAQLVDLLTPDTTNTRIGVANASPTRSTGSKVTYITEINNMFYGKN
jgi:hypothetical protein